MGTPQFSELKKNFLEDCEKARRYVTDEEIQAMSKEEKESAGALYSDDLNRKYFLQPIEITDEEFRTYVIMKQLQELKSIKGMLIFWTVVGIIGIILGIMGYVKLGDMMDSLRYGF